MIKGITLTLATLLAIGTAETQQANLSETGNVPRIVVTPWTNAVVTGHTEAKARWTDLPTTAGGRRAMPFADAVAITVPSPI
jgi:hypothetical protein